MKRGDMVAYVPRVGPKRNRTVYAKVLRWSGDPDSRALLIDTQGKTYRCYSDSMQLLEGDVARGFRLEIDRYLESKAGKDSERTAIARPVRLGGMGMPEGTGSPEFCQEPLSLVKGMTSEPNGWLLQYIRGTWTERLRLRKALGAYNSRYAEVLFSNIDDREPLSAIAKRLGITAANARQIKSRAMRWSRDWVFVAIYGGAA